jgi:DNA-binding MarR family transcriptional regulator
MPTSIDMQPLDDLDSTIHAPTRLKIMAYLAAVESVDFTFLMKQTGLTRGNLSVNLRKLEEAGYVSIQKEFANRVPRTMLCLTTRGREALSNYRVQMQAILADLLKE